MYSIQYYVIKFISELRQVSIFLWVLRFPPQNSWPPLYNWNIVESGVKWYKPKPQATFSVNVCYIAEKRQVKCYVPNSIFISDYGNLFRLWYLFKLKSLQYCLIMLFWKSIVLQVLVHLQSFWSFEGLISIFLWYITLTGYPWYLLHNLSKNVPEELCTLMEEEEEEEEFSNRTNLIFFARIFF